MAEITVTTFIEGTTLAHYTGDNEAKVVEIEAALEAFDAEFLTSGMNKSVDFEIRGY